MVDLPPWLQINPRDYLLATQSGAQMGHAIAEASQRAFEEQQRMQMADQENQAKLAQQAVENAQVKLAADRLEAYRQAEIENRKSELGIQQQGLGLRGEGLDIQRQRANDLFNLSSERESDRQDQRAFRNEIARKMQEDRDKALELREKALEKVRPVVTKLSAGEFGPELSGPVDSPEIVNRLKQIKDKEEAAKNAPNPLVRAYNYLTGRTPPAPSEGSIPMNPVYPNPNDVAAPPPSNQSTSTKVQKAKDLYRKHPEWTKQQVIDAVNAGVE